MLWVLLISGAARVHTLARPVALRGRASTPMCNSATIRRREWLSCFSSALLVGGSLPRPAVANRLLATESKISDYVPPLPENNPGLVILRVAEVAAFQEKLCRAVAAGEGGFGEDINVNRMQIAFGTKVLLKNSRLNDNIKLVLRNIEKGNREAAIFASVTAMNTLGDIYQSASDPEVEDQGLSKTQLLEYADKYFKAREALLLIFAGLPREEQERYYGYAQELRDYEDRVARGDDVEY